jgi:hypothetical protein
MGFAPMPPPPACDLEAARPSPRDFLACRDPGPYTCLRGRGLELLDFDFHLKRLEHAIGRGGIRCVAIVVVGRRTEGAGWRGMVMMVMT